MTTRKKLTLSVDADVIERARRYSKRHQTSISQLVTNYLSQLDASSSEKFSPSVRRLLSILPTSVSEEEYYQHLDEKHSK
jgi:hypothetical protein